MEQQQQQQQQQFAQRMQFLQQQLEVLQHQLGELQQVRETIASVEGIQKDQEVLVPLGAGVYVRGNITPTEKVIMNVGATVVVEKSAKAAEKTVDDQIKQLETIGQQMNEELAQVSQLMQMLQMKQMEAHSHEEKS
jgi:prefoldin alpha subunit